MLSEHTYDDIKQNFLYTKTAYNPSTLNQQDWIELYQDIQVNEKLLLFSEHFKDTKGYGYRCAVFVEQMAKKITFANSGTRFNYGVMAAFYNLWDDLNVMCGFLPCKVKFAQKLNQTILENIGQDLENYKLGVAKIANLIKGALNGFVPEFIMHIFESFKYASLARQFRERSVDCFIEVLITKKALDWLARLEWKIFLQECFDVKNIAFENNKPMQEVNFKALIYA